MDRPEGAPIPPPPPAGTAPVSLTEIKQELDRIERKLHFIMDLPPDMPIPPVPPGVTPVSLTQLEKKLDFIMDLPPGTPIPPVPPGITPVSLTQIQKKLDFIMDLPPGMPIPPVPPGVMPVSLTQIDRKLGAVKRIFVAEEGVFAAASTAEARAIAITAPAGVPRAAFDLSGWIDLREIRSGDVVRVRLDAAVAGRGPLTFAETSFTGLQAKPLKHFRDFAEALPGLRRRCGSSGRHQRHAHPRAAGLRRQLPDPGNGGLPVRGRVAMTRA